MQNKKTPGGIIGGAVANPAPSAVPVVVFAAKYTLCQSSTVILHGSLDMAPK